MAELYLIRHAQASFGSEDYDNLSETGHLQSQLLGEYFKARQISFDYAVTGDMRRHKQTAEGILGSLDKVSSDAGWNEYDFEAVVSAYLRLHPEHKPVENAPRSDWYKVLKAAMLAWSQQKLGHLDEDWLSFDKRVRDAANAVFNSAHKRVLVVSSGGAIGVCLMQILGLSIQRAIEFNLQIKNTSVHHMYFNKASAQLSSFNNVPHLDSLERRHLITYS